MSALAPNIVAPYVLILIWSEMNWEIRVCIPKWTQWCLETVIYCLNLSTFLPFHRSTRAIFRLKNHVEGIDKIMEPEQDNSVIILQRGIFTKNGWQIYINPGSTVNHRNGRKQAPWRRLHLQNLCRPTFLGLNMLWLSSRTFTRQRDRMNWAYSSKSVCLSSDAIVLLWINATSTAKRSFRNGGLWNAWTINHKLLQTRDLWEAMYQPVVWKFWTIRRRTMKRGWMSVDLKLTDYYCWWETHQELICYGHHRVGFAFITIYLAFWPILTFISVTVIKCSFWLA